MGIMDRLSRLLRANVNDALDRAEDPEKMLNQILRDMQDNIQTAREQVAAMIAQEKLLDADLNVTTTIISGTIVWKKAPPDTPQPSANKLPLPPAATGEKGGRRG